MKKLKTTLKKIFRIGKKPVVFVIDGVKYLAHPSAISIDAKNKSIMIHYTKEF